MRRHCAHYTRTLLLPRQRRRPRPNPRIWRAPKIARRESHQRRRCAIFRLIESNQRQQSRQRVFSGTHPTKRLRRNCSSALFSVRKRCCGGEDFTEVKATASFDRIWNFRCAHSSRAWVFPRMVGLLPGQRGRTPMEIPHRRIVPSEEPPVRGEWIH